MTADQKVRLMCVLQAGRYDAVRAKVTISPELPGGFPDTPTVHVDWYDPDNTVANVPATAPENDGHGVRDNLSTLSLETPTLEFGPPDNAVKWSYHRISNSRFGDNFIVAVHPNEGVQSSYRFKPDGQGGRVLSRMELVDASSGGGEPSWEEQWFELSGSLRTPVLTVYPTVDIDTDSDNDVEVERDEWEESIENKSGEPGKIHLVNDDDDDGNGFADKDQPGQFPAADDDLVKAVLDFGLDKYEGLENHKLVLHYPANLRIWKTPTRQSLASESVVHNEQARTFTWTIDSGWDASNPFPLDVWVEAIAPGSAAVNWAMQTPHAQTLYTDGAKFTSIGIDIRRNGASVKNGTTEVMVGANITLEGVVEAGDLPITSKQWTVPGNRIKNYTQTLAKGEVTELEPADLEGEDLTFYWIAGGNDLDVEFEVVVAGVTLHADAKFDVLRPTATLVSVTTSDTPPVAVSDPGFGNGLELHFGSVLSPGIIWTAGVTTPAIGAGEIAFTQLLNTDAHRTLDPGGTIETRTSNGAFVLDNPNPYAGRITAIGDSDTQTHIATDSPGFILTASNSQSGSSDSFDLYLMYRPGGADSIWVTLRRLDWYCSGSATKDPATGVWSLDPGASSSVNPGSYDSSTLPEWDNYFSNLPWQ